eukprot:4278695-Pyramimonas_sp.AAC.2
MSLGGKLADLESGQDEEVYTAQADLANYFYHLAIAEELSEHFAPPRGRRVLAEDHAQAPARHRVAARGQPVPRCLA